MFHPPPLLPPPSSPAPFIYPSPPTPSPVAVQWQVALRILVLARLNSCTKEPHWDFFFWGGGGPPPKCVHSPHPHNAKTSPNTLQSQLSSLADGPSALQVASRAQESGALRHCVGGTWRDRSTCTQKSVPCWLCCTALNKQTNKKSNIHVAKQKKHQQNVEILHHLSKNNYFVFFLSNTLSALILINYYSLDVNMLKVELKLITEKAFSTIKHSRQQFAVETNQALICSWNSAKSNPLAHRLDPQSPSNPHQHSPKALPPSQSGLSLIHRQKQSTSASSACFDEIPNWREHIACFGSKCKSFTIGWKFLLSCCPPFLPLYLSLHFGSDNLSNPLGKPVHIENIPWHRGKNTVV